MMSCIGKCQERREKEVTGPMLARAFAGRYCILAFVDAERISKVKFTSFNGIAAKELDFVV